MGARKFLFEEKPTSSSKAMNDNIAFDRADLKYKVELTAPGFNIDTDEYWFELQCGTKSVKVPQENVINRGGDIFVCLTVEMLKPLGSGELFLVGLAKVPDMDYNNDYRREVCRLKLINLVVL